VAALPLRSRLEISDPSPGGAARPANIALPEPLTGAPEPAAGHRDR
jgi:hypothetical protein